MSPTQDTETDFAAAGAAIARSVSVAAARCFNTRPTYPDPEEDMKRLTGILVAVAAAAVAAGALGGIAPAGPPQCPRGPAAHLGAAHSGGGPGAPPRRRDL